MLLSEIKSRITVILFIKHQQIALGLINYILLPLTNLVNDLVA